MANRNFSLDTDLLFENNSYKLKPIVLD